MNDRQKQQSIRTWFDKMMFVFASKNINQAYKRLKYIQQYAEYRKGQAIEIVATQAKLEGNIALLNQSNEEKTVLVSLEEQQKQNLNSSRASTKKDSG